MSVDREKREDRGGRPKSDANPSRKGRRLLAVDPVDMRIEPHGETLRITLRNEVVMGNMMPVKESFYRALDEHHPHTVDLDISAVPYADSSALGMFLEFRRSLKHSHACLRLINPAPNVMRVINVMSLDRVLDIVQEPKTP